MGPTRDKTLPVMDEKAELLKRLEQELLEHNDFFDMLVDMIPSKLYVAGRSSDVPNPKYFKGPSKNEASHKGSAKVPKRPKLDHAGSASTKEDDVSSKPNPPLMGSTEKSQGSQQQLTPGQSRIEALRAKLHAKLQSKIASKQASVFPGADGNDAETVSKRAARRLEKQRRKEEAKKRAKKQTGTATSNPNTTAYTITPTTPVLDPLQDLQHVDFGILSGLNTDSKKNYLEANKALSSKGKNLHKILADAEAKHQKLQALKNSSDTKDKEKAEAIQWSDTFKEADGARVKDDPSKVRKAIKRKEAKKTKSQKAWKTRMQQQSETAKNRQQIRQHNLQTRQLGGAAGANLSKKRIADPETNSSDKTRKGGRAGFEGRKQGFLNSPKEVTSGNRGKQQ